jgi:hypothetical protein
MRIVSKEEQMEERNPYGADLGNASPARIVPSNAQISLDIALQ